MIGELIKVLRTEKGVGVLELAKKLGINRISLFRIEKGERQPSERTAIAAFKALGLSEKHIYAVFVFNEMIRWKMISNTVKQNEANLVLQRLKARDKESTILYRYFRRILNEHRNGNARNRS